MWLALAGAALLTCTGIPQTASAKTRKGCSELVTLQPYRERLIYYLHSHWLCSTKDSSMSSCLMWEVRISCGQIRKKKGTVQVNSSAPKRRSLSACRATDTSMVSVLVSRGTHSRASSVQQPPHRLKDTQDGTKRLCVSPGSSRHTSTRVSRGSHPLREYTSSHRLTGGHMGLRICSFIRQPYLCQATIRGGNKKGVPSRPSLDFGESAGRQ